MQLSLFYIDLVQIIRHYICFIVCLACVNITSKCPEHGTGLYTNMNLKFDTFALFTCDFCVFDSISFCFNVQFALRLRNKIIDICTSKTRYGN